MFRGVLILVILLAMTFISIESYAITIGPTRLEARLPPGEIADADYYVQNETDAPIHVSVEPENWGKDAYDYTKLDIKDWVKVDCPEFDLKPMEIKKLKLTINVPKKRKGEIVAQIFFVSSAIKSAEEAGGSLRTRLGSVLYIAIKGTEIVKADIVNIGVSDAAEIEGAQDKLRIDTLVHNGGNVHIRPGSGEIIVTDEKGLTIAKMDMVTDHSILPNQDFAYPVLLSKDKLTKGKYIISAEIKYGKMYGREKTAKREKMFEVNKEGKVSVK